MISQRALQAFRVFAEVGSIAAAAEKLRRTPPQIGRLLHQLEQETKLSLLDRNCRPPVLTSDGRDFFTRVNRALSELDDIEQFAWQLNQRKNIDHIRLLTTPFVGHAMAADAIAAMMGVFPSFTASVETRLRLDIETWLHQESFDLCVTVLPFSHPDFLVEEFIEVDVVAVVPIGHSLSGRKTVLFEDLARHEIIATNKRSILQMHIDDLSKERNIPIRYRFEAKNGILACQMASRGIGCCIADPFIAHSSLSPGVTIKRFEPSLKLRYAFIFEKRKRGKTILNNMKYFIKENAINNYNQICENF